MLTSEYNFPVYGTQGGGLVEEVAPDLYVFVVAPEAGMGLGVGDYMPKEWGVAPANQLARDVISNHEGDLADAYFMGIDH